MKKKPVFQEGQALQNEDSAILKLLVSLTAVQISDLMLYVLIRQNCQLLILADKNFLEVLYLQWKYFAVLILRKPAVLPEFMVPHACKLREHTLSVGLVGCICLV